MGDGFRRAPEENASSHCGGKGDSKPAHGRKLRLGIFASDANIAKFRNHSPNGNYYNGKSQQAGCPAKV